MTLIPAKVHFQLLAAMISVVLKTQSDMHWLHACLGGSITTRSDTTGSSKGPWNRSKTPFKVTVKVSVVGLRLARIPLAFTLLLQHESNLVS